MSEDDPRLSTPPVSSIDPGYSEPISLESFRALADEVNRTLAVARGNADLLEQVEVQRTRLMEFLLTRVASLEHALLPFATAAIVMSNARMCLIAAGRPKDPAGGVFISNVENVTLQPNEGLFFNACDALGRQFVQDHIEAVFNHAREAAERQEEKQHHVDDGGTVH